MHRTVWILTGWLTVMLCLTGCERSKRAFNQVLTDFRLRPQEETGKPDADLDLFARLTDIGEHELDRLNADPANAEVKFEKIPNNPLELGSFHRMLKVYEQAFPLEVERRRVGQVQQAQTIRKPGYRGRIEYRYRVYRGEDFPTRVEARDSAADQRTDDSGREIYIYYFDENGVWDGEPGKLERRSRSMVEKSSSSGTSGRAGCPGPAGAALHPLGAGCTRGAHAAAHAHDLCYLYRGRVVRRRRPGSGGAHLAPHAARRGRCAQ